jgi:hypothetical protein
MDDAQPCVPPQTRCWHGVLGKKLFEQELVWRPSGLARQGLNCGCSITSRSASSSMVSSWRACRPRGLGRPLRVVASCLLVALSGPTEMSAIWPLSGAKRTSASDYLTIAIYEYTPLERTTAAISATSIAATQIAGCRHVRGTVGSISAACKVMSGSSFICALLVVRHRRVCDWRDGGCWCALTSGLRFVGRLGPKEAAMSRRKREDANTHNHCNRDASNCPVAVRNIQARYFIATTHDATFL